MTIVPHMTSDINDSMGFREPLRANFKDILFFFMYEIETIT